MEVSNTHYYKISHDKFPVEALLQRIGDEVLLSIWGGKAHIGAVAMAQPRPSLSDPEKISSTVSVFCYTGHKEDDIAKKAAGEIASALSVRTVVAAGLHWENLSQTDVLKVVEIVEALIKKIIIEETHGNK